MSYNISYTTIDNKNVTINWDGVVLSYDRNTLFSISSGVNLGNQSGTTRVASVHYPGIVLWEYNDTWGLCQITAFNIHIGSYSWYFVEASRILISKNTTSYSELYGSTAVADTTNAYPKDLDNVIKIMKPFHLTGVEYSVLTKEEMIEFICSKELTYHNVPIMKDNTKINYTDGTYEVIDEVLTEQQAKDHAYINLLNTYGTFYKANEVDISGAYKKQI